MPGNRSNTLRHPPPTSARRAAPRPSSVPRGDNSIPTYGAEPSASHRSTATAALAAYLKARTTGDWSAACQRMATAVHKQLVLLVGPASKGKAEGCAEAYAALSARVPAQNEPTPSPALSLPSG